MVITLNSKLHKLYLQIFLAPGIDTEDRPMFDPWQSWRNVESPRPKQEVSQATKAKAGQNFFGLHVNSDVGDQTSRSKMTKSVS